MYKTLKDAFAAGYKDIKPDEYGGEQIRLKGHTLVKNAKTAISESAWRCLGFKPARGAVPHAWVSGKVGDGSKSMRWAVYREDQVVRKQKREERPSVEIDILLALWGINRYAKRCRDAAASCYQRGNHAFAELWSGRKSSAYTTKSQALHYLVESGRLTVVGNHRFPAGLFAEVLQGEGYTFHRPCPAPAVDGVVEVQTIGGIEAKPKEKAEPRLLDAQFTVGKFLAGRPTADVYEWPPRERPRRWRDADERWNDEDEEFDFDGSDEAA